jgi:predicted RNA polymerase sigma factor
VVRLNRAVALRSVAGPVAALDEVEALARDLEGSHRFHAIPGAFLLKLGRSERARAAELRALALTDNQAEQILLRQRLATRDSVEDLLTSDGLPGNGNDTHV